VTHQDSHSSDSLPDSLWLPSDWPDVHVAVALSGGADSVALLRALVHRKKETGRTGALHALHVDHRLRGMESDADAQWCRELCESLGVSFELQTCDTAALAAKQGDGMEAAARAQRYELLTDAAERAGVRYLATAHTRDDQVETVLFRILRGTGLRGLAGIPQSRPLTPAVTLIRPLLATSRESVIHYLTELGQTHRIDGSNTDLRYTRNRLRHELLPLLREKYNAEIDAALVRLAAQASDAQGVVEREAQRLLETPRLATSPQTIALECTRFANHAPTLVREALRLVWRESGFPEQGMTHEWWNRLATLALQAASGTVLNLPGNVRASIVDERLVLER